MRILVACKRGNVAPRSNTGHCLCDACVEFRRSRSREYNRKNKAAKAEWQKRNPDKTKAYCRKWRSENPEKRKQAVSSWRERNPAAVAAMNAAAGAKWARENKGARNAITRRRQIKKTQQTPSWAIADAIKAIYDEAARLTRQTGIPHEVDHIIPLNGENVCGLHVETNLRVITRTANRRKQNRMEEHDDT